jgi:hypothetical protein
MVLGMGGGTTGQGRIRTGDRHYCIGELQQGDRYYRGKSRAVFRIRIRSDPGLFWLDADLSLITDHISKFLVAINTLSIFVVSLFGP